MSQSNDAAERSAHVLRGAAEPAPAEGKPLIREWKNEKGETMGAVDEIMRLREENAALRAAAAPVPVRIYREPGALLPVQATPGAAGYDLCANIYVSVGLNPGQRALIPTGIHLAVPPGYEAQIRPRSGMAYREGVTVLNAPGTIDSDYRGEVAVLLINHSEESTTIAPGERIAQLVFAPVTSVRLDVVANRETLGDTARGAGGFGSTGTV